MEQMLAGLLEMLLEAAAAATSAESCSALWPDLAASVGAVLGCTAFALILLDTDGSGWAMTAHHRTHAHSWIVRWPPHGQALCGRLQRRFGQCCALGTEPREDRTGMEAWALRGGPEGPGPALSLPGDAGTLQLFLIDGPRSPRRDARSLRHCAEVLRHLGRFLRLETMVHTLRSANAALEGVLDELPVGVAVLESDGHVVHANEQARYMMRSQEALQLSRGRLRALRPRDDQRLRRLMSRMALEQGVRAPAVMALPRRSGRRAYTLAVSPLNEAGRHPVRGRRVAALMTDPEAGSCTNKLALRNAHGLTEREAELAYRLAGGQSLAEAARQMQVRPRTARTHLESLFRKTSTHRQSDLVRVMLAGTPMLRSRE